MTTAPGSRDVTVRRGIRLRARTICRSGPIQRGLLVAFAFVLGTTARAHAQSAENVAVVINEASADSRRIGEYYVQKRGIPAGNVIRIRTAVEEQIDAGVFVRTIEGPITDQLSRENLQDRILYIVLTKGVPLLITGTGGRQATRASVDSELTLLYRRLAGRPVLAAGPVPNPYFLGTAPIARHSRLPIDAMTCFSWRGSMPSPSTMRSPSLTVHKHQRRMGESCSISALASAVV